MLDERRKKALDDVLQELGHWFENVVVLVSVHEADTTSTGNATQWATRARGNHFANTELARHFIKLEEKSRSPQDAQQLEDGTDAP